MPAKQRGQIYKSGKTWGVRFYDETGARRRQGGFASKTAAGEWWDTKVDEVAALRRGDPVALRRRQIKTLDELCDEYLEQHTAEANTIRTLTARLKRARDTFGDLPLDRLVVSEIKAWRKGLPERSAWHYHKALRQVLNYAVAAGLLDANPATKVPNPEPKRREVLTFETWADVELVADEMGNAVAPIPLFAAGTGLRPEEWIGLERRDVDVAGRVVHVRRVFTDGRVKDYGKQERSLRVVPLPGRVVAAIEGMAPRIDTRLLFPGEKGGHLNLHNWRADHWTPAVKAAGLEHRPPYALRHTYASFSIAAGVPLFELARFMGTSVEQIDKTYGHLLPDAFERTRSALDTFLATEKEATNEQR